jgi:F-box/leucine-rich repeat protein 7
LFSSVHNYIKNQHTAITGKLLLSKMSFTLSVRQSPLRLAQRLPELSKSAFRSTGPMRSFHKTAKPATNFFTSRVSSVATRNAFAQGAGRSYYQEATQQAATSGTGLRKLLVGGAIFGGTLVAINAVFNRETREDGGMPLYEREYLNNTFLHTRLMVTNPWVVGLGGLALSFATMIGTRSISPDK